MTVAELSDRYAAALERCMVNPTRANRDALRAADQALRAATC